MPRPVIEVGQIWREVDTDALVRVRSIRASDVGQEIFVENVEDTSINAVWTLEEFLEYYEPENE